ncbi:MAG: SGNH/GDSL hydrolase family protein [Planctomycetota bacterium]|jgi:lysophospholipase L1-like esterase
MSEGGGGSRGLLLKRILVFALLMPLLFVLLTEGLLRLVWSNPYLATDQAEQTWINGDGHLSLLRLHPPGLDFHANATGLYQGAGELRVRWSEIRNLVAAGEVRDDVLVFGGSTTECALVPEGFRWPELLDPPALNFGVSGNTLIESYRNLRYLLEVGGLRPERVLLMHGVNDLHELLSRAEDFELRRWVKSLPVDFLRREGREEILGIPVRESSLLSFVRFNRGEFFGRGHLEQSLQQRREQERLPLMSEEEFRELQRRLADQWLPKRSLVFEALAQLAKTYAFELQILTQPHAFDERYRPFGVDLRQHPLWEGRRANLEQAAGLMGMINEHSRVSAARLGLPLHDLAKCIGELDPSPLFFDAVHFTPVGCQAVAACLKSQ